MPKNIVISSLMILSLSLAAHAKDSDFLKITLVDQEFAKFIMGLEDTIKERNIKGVLSKVSSKFSRFGDLGGANYDELSTTEIFNDIFRLDNKNVSTEYKDYGWKKLEKLLSTKTYKDSEFRKNEICTPRKNMDEQAFYVAKLCFSRENNSWVISSYFYGGE